MSNFDILLIAHLIGDYLFQTNWMAANKVKEWPPLIFHSFIYTSIIWIISILGFQGLSFKACIFIFVCHIVLDQRQLVKLWSDKIMGLKDGEPSWLRTMVDQTFHLIVLALALYI